MASPAKMTREERYQAAVTEATQKRDGLVTALRARCEAFNKDVLQESEVPTLDAARTRATVMMAAATTPTAVRPKCRSFLTDVQRIETEVAEAEGVLKGVTQRPPTPAKDTGTPAPTQELRPRKINFYGTEVLITSPAGANRRLAHSTQLPLHHARCRRSSALRARSPAVSSISLSLADASSWPHQLAHTDASSSRLGAVTRDAILQRSDLSSKPINVKENRASTDTFAYLAARTSEPSRFILPTDNRSNASWIRKGTARDPHARASLEAMATLAVRGGHCVRAPWVPGRHIIDVGADAASRQAIPSALSLPVASDVARAIDTSFRAQLPGVPSWAEQLREALLVGAKMEGYE